MKEHEGKLDMESVARLMAERRALPTDHADRPSKEEAEAAVRTLVRWIGEEHLREGLLDTPKRVAKAYREMFGGYDEDPVDVLGRTFDEVGGYNDVVLVRDIQFFSHCEHHMVPFYGKAHIAYYPDGRVVGLSKLARVVEIYARRLQTQENLTAEIGMTIDEVLKPRGVAVMIEAEHMCMVMRGVRKAGASTVTRLFTGRFREDSAEQGRFLAMLGGSA